jgi:hypothetical protein
MTSDDSQALIHSFPTQHGKIFLLSGDTPIFRLSLYLTALTVRDGASLALIDGANRFDVHAITAQAQRWQMPPQGLLERIFISRGFTCYQMEAAITERLPAFLARRSVRTAVILGLLDSFYDEQIKFQIAREMLQHIIAACHAMKTDGISLLLACKEWDVRPKERNQFLHMLRQGADRTYRLAAQTEEHMLGTGEHRTIAQPHIVQSSAVTQRVHGQGGSRRMRTTRDETTGNLF